MKATFLYPSIHAHPFSQYSSLYISFGTDRENLFINQSFFKFDDQFFYSYSHEWFSNYCREKLNAGRFLV